MIILLFGNIFKIALFIIQVYQDQHNTGYLQFAVMLGTVQPWDTTGLNAGTVKLQNGTNTMTQGQENIMDSCGLIYTHISILML